MKYLNETNQLYDKQHEFRSKLSCETQLIEFTAYMLKVLQDREYCDTVVIEFSKAFDKVSHDGLLYKLDCTGIDPKASRWIKSFLSSRSHRVVINGE